MRSERQIVADARHVAANPERYCDSPSLRLLAWSTLMHERGHRVDQLQLARMQRQARLPLAQRLLPRIAAKVIADDPTPGPSDGGWAA